MMLPTISLATGTSPTALIHAHRVAREALRNAIYAVNETAPNGRDYPTPGTDGQALEEHDARMEALRTVLRELEIIGESIADQQDALHDRPAE